MRRIFIFIILFSIVLHSETLFEVKDASNNKVLDISTDGLRVMNLGDTLMVISSSEIKANLESSKGLSRSFSVTTSASKGTVTDLMKLTSDSTRFWISDTGSGFGVSALNSGIKSVTTNFLHVNSNSTEMREGSAGYSYTDFSPENIFLGLNSGANTTPINPTLGENNVFVGNLSGFTNTTGASNVFVGYKSGYSNLSGYNNCFMGQESGYSNYSGRMNVFIGNKAGYNNYDGNYNVFIGYNCGVQNTSGSRNIFIGYESGILNSTGWGNTFVGEASGTANTTGFCNSMFGNNAGFANTEGDYNTSAGYSAGGSITTGNYNSSFGAESGRTNQTGSGNSVFGFEAGRGSPGYSHSNNSFFGYRSGYAITTGSNNTYLGYSSGYSNTTGTGNVFLGYQAGYSETASNKLYIDNSSTANPLIYGDFSSDYVKINGDFDVLNLATVGGLDVNGDAIVDGTFTASKINTTAAGDNYLRVTSTTPTIAGIELFRTGASYRDWRIYNTGGNLKFGYSADELATATDIFQILYSGYVGIGSTAPSQKLDVYGGNGRVESGYSWLTSSDVRYKTNVTTLENSLSNVLKMRGVRYDLKEDKSVVEGKGKHIGFIAQELEEIYDELVVEDENGYKSVAYDKVNAVLVEAIKEQQKMIDDLKKEIEKLKAK